MYSHVVAPTDGMVHGIAKRLTSYRSIALIWMMVLSLTLPPLFGWSEYVPEGNGMR